MLKAFVRDSAIYGAATVLVRGVALLAVPILTRFLSPADYGTIDIVAVFTSFAGVIVSLEIVQAVARFYPDTPDADERVSIASTSLWFAVFGYGVLLVVGQLFAPELATWLLGSEVRASVIRVALVAISANGVFYVIQSQLRWRLLAARYAVASVAYAVVSIGASVVFIVAGAGVAGVFEGQVVGAVVGGILSMSAVRADYRWRVDRAKLRAMLAFSIPLVPSSLGLYVTLYIDRLSINAFLGLTAVGLFGVGYRVASLVTLANVGIQGALTPLIYTHFREDATPREIGRLFRIYAAGTIALWLGLGLYARELLAAITTPAYADGAVVVPLLAPALILGGLYIFAPGLNIAKRTGRVALVNIGGAVANTALNVLLVPRAGIVGAATATLISSAIVFGSNMVLSQRAYPVPHDWRSLAVAAAGASLILVLGWQLSPSLIAIGVKAVLLFLEVALCIAVGLVRVDELRGLGRAVARRVRKPADAVR
jgi:O-antigen/teichoic acid export membrane protein